MLARNIQVAVTSAYNRIHNRFHIVWPFLTGPPLCYYTMLYNKARVLYHFRESKPRNGKQIYVGKRTHTHTRIYIYIYIYICGLDSLKCFTNRVLYL